MEPACGSDNNGCYKDDSGNLREADGGLYHLPRGPEMVVNVNGDGLGSGPSDQSERIERPDLPDGPEDLIPIYGSGRRMIYNMNCRTGGCNIDRALWGFIHTSVDIYTVGKSLVEAGGKIFVKEVIEETAETGATTVVRNSVDDVATNLNSNNAVGNFGVYKIDIDGAVHKFGKADLDRVTQSSGLPTRIHQQVRQLRKAHPDSEVSATVVKTLTGSTTRQAKSVENATIRNHVRRTGQVPPGNAKSYRGQ